MKQFAHLFRAQWLEAQGYRAGLTSSPVRALVQQFGPGKGEDQDRQAAAPFQQMLDEIEQATVCPVEVLEDQCGRAALGNPLEEGPPRSEQLLATARRRVPHAKQHEQPRLDPATLLGVGDELAQHFSDGGARRPFVGVLGEPRPSPDHLAQRPERDPAAVGR